MIGEFRVDDRTLHQMNAGFQNRPLIVDSQGGGERTEWQLLQEDLPLSGLYLDDGKALARFFNPTTRVCAFSREYIKTDVWGNPTTMTKTVHPKGIVTVSIEQPLPPLSDLSNDHIVISLDGPSWRVDENQGLPDAKTIEKIKERIAQLERRLEQTEEQLNQATGNDRYFLQHIYYVLKRELYEYRLSAQLNTLKLAMQNRLSYEYLYTQDDEVAEVGWQLNQLRIKRRIYDYIVQAV
jgi:hypothetical protein